MDFIRQKRVWVDESTHRDLAIISRITRGYITRDMLFNRILYEWNNSIDPRKVGNIILGDGDQKIYCAWILVEEGLWNDFIYRCHRNNLDINIGFRIALYNFLFIVDNNYDNVLGYFLGY